MLPLVRRDICYLAICHEDYLNIVWALKSFTRPMGQISCWSLLNRKWECELLPRTELVGLGPLSNHVILITHSNNLFLDNNYRIQF